MYALRDDIVDKTRFDMGDSMSILLGFDAMQSHGRVLATGHLEISVGDVSKSLLPHRATCRQCLLDFLICLPRPNLAAHLIAYLSSWAASPYLLPQHHLSCMDKRLADTLILMLIPRNSASPG